MYTNENSPTIVDIAYDGPFQIPLTSRSIINISISIPKSEIDVEPIIQSIDYNEQLNCHEAIKA